MSDFPALAERILKQVRAAGVLGADVASKEDGLLQAREISALRLNAGLVVLSACDTGVGRLQGAEGIANLVRSFLFAGAQSVLASLWSADDIATAALVRQFYTHLAEKKDKGWALRQAPLSFRALDCLWRRGICISLSGPTSRPLGSRRIKASG